jgi:cell division protein FtsZ
MGMALMGTGIAEGERRAVEAAQRAISSPLLEDTSIHGARGVLINITGGEDMTLHEVSEAAQIIQEASDPDANIIFGTVIDRGMQGRVKVTVIATGFNRDDVRATHAGMSAGRHGDRVPAPSAMDTVVSGRTARGFFRPGKTEEVELDAADQGFTPNFGKMKDDLDVPAFLRKQMD